MQRWIDRDRVDVRLALAIAVLALMDGGGGCSRPTLRNHVGFFGGSAELETAAADRKPDRQAVVLIQS